MSGMSSGAALEIRVCLLIYWTRISTRHAKRDSKIIEEWSGTCMQAHKMCHEL
ncbi:hypothetical protein K438DRAFT_1884280 [Mycena galopus ATCC 62051]|nr:hypothetical protein K438DRAFT_1884280 [Mycena galopus ATCC 62051]